MMMKVGLLLTLLCVVLVAEASIKGGRRRPGPLVGGWRKMDKNSTEAQELAKKAAEHLDSSRNSAMAYRVQEVHSVKQQLVNGMNYQVVLSIAQTDCRRGQNLNLANCSAVKIQRCSVAMYASFGSQSTQMTNHSCGTEKTVTAGKTTRRPRPVGGEQNIDVNDESVRQAAVFATSELTNRSNGQYSVQRQRIVKATSQVVSGMMYRMTMEVSLSFQNGQTKTTRCRVAVWDQAWLNPRYKLNEYNCKKHIS